MAQKKGCYKHNNMLLKTFILKHALKILKYAKKILSRLKKNCWNFRN